VHACACECVYACVCCCPISPLSSPSQAASPSTDLIDKFWARLLSRACISLSNGLPRQWVRLLHNFPPAEHPLCGIKGPGPNLVVCASRPIAAGGDVATGLSHLRLPARVESDPKPLAFQQTVESPTAVHPKASLCPLSQADLDYLHGQGILRPVPIHKYCRFFKVAQGELAGFICDPAGLVCPAPLFTSHTSKWLSSAFVCQEGHLCLYEDQLELAINCPLARTRGGYHALHRVPQGCLGAFS